MLTIATMMKGYLVWILWRLVFPSFTYRWRHHLMEAYIVFLFPRRVTQHVGVEVVRMFQWDEFIDKGWVCEPGRKLTAYIEHMAEGY